MIAERKHVRVVKNQFSKVWSIFSPVRVWSTDRTHIFCSPNRSLV